MGKYADYMLDGSDCAGCGMPFMDDNAAGVTHEDRWQQMRDWVVRQLRSAP